MCEEEELDYEEALSECSFSSDNVRPPGTVSAVLLDPEPYFPRSLFPKAFTEKYQRSKPTVNHNNLQAINTVDTTWSDPRASVGRLNKRELQGYEQFPKRQRKCPPSRASPQHGLTGNLPRPDWYHGGWPPPPHMEPSGRSPGWRGPPEALKELQNMKVSHSHFVPATPPHSGYHRNGMAPHGGSPGPCVGGPHHNHDSWGFQDHQRPHYNQTTTSSKPAFIADHNSHDTPPWLRGRPPSVYGSHSQAGSSPLPSSLSSVSAPTAPAEKPDAAALTIDFNTPVDSRDKTLFDDNEDERMEKELMELFEKNCPAFFPDRRPCRSRHGSGNSLSSIDAILSTTGHSDTTMKTQSSFLTFNNEHFDVGLPTLLKPQENSSDRNSQGGSCSDRVLDSDDHASLSGKSDDLSLTSSGGLRPSRQIKAESGNGSDCGSIISQAKSNDHSSVGSLVAKVERANISQSDEALSQCGSEHSSLDSATPPPARVLPPDWVSGDTTSEAGSSDSFISQQSSLSSLVSKVAQTKLTVLDCDVRATAEARHNGAPSTSRHYGAWRPTSPVISDTGSETSGGNSSHSALLSHNIDFLSQVTNFASTLNPEMNDLLTQLASSLPRLTASSPPPTCLTPTPPDPQDQEDSHMPVFHSHVNRKPSLSSPSRRSSGSDVPMSPCPSSPAHSDSMHSVSSSPMSPFPLPDFSRPPPGFPHDMPSMSPTPPPMSPSPMDIDGPYFKMPPQGFKPPQSSASRSSHNGRKKVAPYHLRMKETAQSCLANLATIRNKLARHGDASQPDRLVAPSQAQQHADMSFSQFGLRQELVDGMSKKGIEAMTMLQCQCMAGALSGQNLMMFAKKGTGKSLVHVLAVLNKFQPVDGEVFAVVVCTIRDHAYRVKALYDELARGMPKVVIADCIGGNGKMRQLREMMKRIKPNIVIGTIGRMDTLNKKIGFLKNVRFLICEEMGHIAKFPYLQRDLQKIISQCSSELQLIGTSAECHADDMERVNEYFPGGLVVVQFGYWSIPTVNVEHFYLTCDLHNRLSAVFYLLQNVPYKKVVIYINDPIVAKNMAKFLQNKKYKAFAFYGQFSNNTSKMEGYSCGKAMVDQKCEEYDVIVSRKMVPRVNFDLIIHCDLPLLPIIFLNRVRNCDGISKVRSVILVHNEARAMYVKDIYDGYLNMSISSLPNKF